MTSVAAPTPPNLLLVTVDCMRADHVGFLGHQVPTTPHLDELAASSIVFSRAIVAGTPTYYSFPAILAGRYPFAHGRDLTGLAEGEPTFAGFLRDRGYHTGAFVAQNPYISRVAGYSQGFDHFDDFRAIDRSPAPAEQPSGSSLGWLNRVVRHLARRNQVLDRVYDRAYLAYGMWRRARAVDFDYRRLLRAHVDGKTLVDQATAWLTDELKSSRPWFLWLHFMDAHRPYCASEEAVVAVGRPQLTPRRQYLLRQIWLSEKRSVEYLARYRDEYVALYDACIRTVDTEIGRVLGFLGDHDLMASTAVVVTADHGEGFLEHGQRDHNPVSLHQEIVRVPLLIRPPGGTTPVNVESPFSLVDLVPTTASVLGLDGTTALFPGRSRWSDVVAGRSWSDPVLTELTYDTLAWPRRIAAANRMVCVQDERHKLVVDFEEGKEALFDLEADPREEHPLPLASDRAVSGRFLGAVVAHMRTERANRYSGPEMATRLTSIAPDSAEITE